MKYTCVILAAGKTATGLPVPEEVVHSLDAGRRPAVYVTIGDYTYRSTVAPYSEGYRIPLSAEHRAAAETRQRRVVQGVELLRGGRAHR